MASEVGSAYFTLLPSVKGLQGAIAKEVSGVDGTAAGDKVGSQMGGGIAGGIKRLVGPAIALAGAVGFAGYIKEAAAASDATDKFKSTLNFAGLDNSAVKQATKDAQDYADKTVYELSDIQQTMAQLAANGVSNYTGITKAAGNLNAVAGGNAETFKSVSRAVSQSAGAGKLMTEDWNMLADAIPGASGQLQKAMKEAGAFEGDFKKAMETGQITAEEFQAAIVKLGDTPIASEAAQSTTTFEGALGNLNATIVGGLTGAVSAVKPALTGMITGVSTGLGTAFTWVGDFFSGMKSLIMDNDYTGALGRALGVEEDSPVVDMLFKFQDTFWSVFRSVGDIFKTLGDSLGPVAGQVLGLWTSFSPLSLLFQALQPLLPTIVGLFTELASMLGPVLGQSLALVQPILQQLVELLVNNLTAALPAINAMITVFTGALTQIIPVVLGVVGAVVPLVGVLIGQLAPIFTNLVTSLLPPLVSIFSSVVNAIAPLITQLADLLIPVILALMPVVVTVFSVVASVVTAAMQVVQGVVQVVTGLISGNWDAVWNGMRNILEGVWNVIVAVVRGALQIIGQVVISGVQLAVSFASSAFQGFLEFLGGVWGAIVGVVRGAVSGLGSAISSGFNSAVGWAQSAMGGLLGFLGGVWGNILNGASGAVGGLIGFFSGLPGRILGALGGLAGQLASFGSNMMQGFVNGVTGMATSILNSAVNAVKGAVDGVKKFLGIASPSKLARKLGGFFGEGWVQGVDDWVDPAQAAMLRVVTPPDPAVTALATAGSRYGYDLDQGEYRSGPLVEQNVYPSEKMSEQNLADVAAGKIVEELV